MAENHPANALFRSWFDLRVNNMELKAGQVWAVRSNDQLPPLLVMIGRIDHTQRGGIASVCVSPHPEAQELGWPTVSHLPVAVEALGLENAQLMDENASTDEGFEEGYENWIEQFYAGKAGAFSISALEAYGVAVGIANSQE